jgi:hypothetical protein
MEASGKNMSGNTLPHSVVHARSYTNEVEKAEPGTKGGGMVRRIFPFCQLRKERKDRPLQDLKDVETEDVRNV